MLGHRFFAVVSASCEQNRPIFCIAEFRDPSQAFQRLRDHHIDLSTLCSNLKFPGRGQRETPVAPIPVLIEIAWLCNGKNAARFRREGVHVFCRALGGDLSLVDEIKARHGMMEGTLEQEALLEGTGVTMAEANGHAAVPAPLSELAALELEERKMRLKERNLLLDALKTILSPTPPVENTRLKTSGIRRCTMSSQDIHQDIRRLLYYECSRCGYVCSLFSKLREHTQRKKCRDAGVYRCVLVGAPESREPADA